MFLITSLMDTCFLLSQQENGYLTGPFVLFFMECSIDEAPQTLNTRPCSSNFMPAHWIFLFNLIHYWHIFHSWLWRVVQNLKKPLGWEGKSDICFGMRLRLASEGSSWNCSSSCAFCFLLFLNVYWLHFGNMELELAPVVVLGSISNPTPNECQTHGNKSNHSTMLFPLKGNLVNEKTPEMCNFKVLFSCCKRNTQAVCP